MYYGQINIYTRILKIYPNKTHVKYREKPMKKNRQ